MRESEDIMVGRRTLLVVDDMKINRSILRRILSKDYVIREAANGKEALEILEENPEEISAILLDLVMPIMDGYAFLRTMKKNPSIFNIPVIVMTQENKEKSEVEALKEGANDFLNKPYNAAVIKHRVNNIIPLRETAAYVNAVEHDSMTKVYSKEAFYTRAKEMMQRNPELEYMFLCMDIADFKLVNDLYGEAEGDKILKAAASLLEETFGAMGGKVGRLSGDIFLLIVPKAASGIEEAMQKYYQKLNEYPINMELNAQFGIYFRDDTKQTVRAMCDYAKIAIQKTKGKYNHIISYYDKEIHERLLEEQKLSHEMKGALKHREFEMLLQPKYDLQTEEIVGAESLVRWNHPQRGVLSPGIFIPLFEKNGFITSLDMYIWEEACKKIREWLDAGNQSIPISVNVSRVDLYKPRLPEIIMGLVDKYEIEPQWLHLEITETAYTIHPEQLVEVITKLRKLGFHIEMDDFGSGYSSLNMLNEVPVDTIKLDIGFLKNNDVNHNTGNIIHFVMSLAKWLEVSVVTEGVETKEQYLFLKSMSCSYGQGYYFSRPLQEKDFEHLLKISKISNSLKDRYESKQMVSKEAMWKTDSEFNLIFNVYPGALVICEYQDGKLNLIRGNEEFQSLFSLEDGKRLCKELEGVMEEPRDMQTILDLKIKNSIEKISIHMKIISEKQTRSMMFLNVKFLQK